MEELLIQTPFLWVNTCLTDISVTEKKKHLFLSSR